MSSYGIEDLQTKTIKHINELDGGWTDTPEGSMREGGYKYMHGLQACRKGDWLHSRAS